MNRRPFVFKQLFVLFTAMLLSFSAFGQIQTSSNSYSGCPNQIITVSITWPNVGGTTYSITSPVGALPASSFLGNVASFTISAPGGAGPGPTVYTYTLSGNGTSLAGPVTSVVYFNLTITPPAPMAIANQTFYCPGQTATLTAPLGGTLFNVSGPVNINGITSNIINIASLGPQHNGTVTITSIGTCTLTGTTVISVAPNTPLAVSAPTNVCQWLPGDPPAAVTVSANLVTAINYQWFSPLNQALSTAQVHLLANPQPTDAGVYLVTADFPWGPTTLCPRSATTQVNVVPKDVVNVSASPANVVCQGTKVNFSAISNGAIGWSWTGPQAFAASISNPNINPAGPLNSGVYTVTALFTNNIITCSQRGTVGVNVITVNQPLIQMPSSACQGLSANLSWNANGSNFLYYNVVGPNSYSIMQTTMTSDNILNLMPIMSGIYYVTSVFGIGSTTCAATNSVQFNVVPVNTITVVPPNPVCEPANGYLQASATGANSYSWTGPNNFQAYGSNVVVYYPKPNATGVYTVTATFGGGNITCPNTNTVSLTVNPVLNFSLVARQESCYNKPISVSGPSGATSYSWTASNGFKANSKDIGFSSIQPENSGTYTLVVALGPCTSSASTIIEVLTPVSFTLRPNSRTICQGDSTVLEAGLTGGSQNYAYLWNPSTFMATPDGPKKVAVPLGSMIYNVTAHDIACPNFTVGHSFSVSVNLPPKPDLQLAKTAACAPFCQIYDAKLNGTSAVTTFDFGGSRKYQGEVIKACLNDPGTYSLTIYTTAKGTGCKGKFQFMYPLEVYPRPGASVWWTPENPTPDDEVTLHYGVNSGPVNYFQWSFLGGKPSVLDTAINYNVPGSDTSNLANPIRRYDKIGTYPLLFVVKNEKECVDSVARYVKVTDNFNVYIPNTFTPNEDGVNDVFMVKGTGIRTDNFSMEITDRAGSPVFSTTDVNEGWNGKSNGRLVKDNVYIYRIRAVGMNGEGRKEFIGKVTVLK